MSLYKLAMLIATIGLGNHLWQKHKIQELDDGRVTYSEGKFISTAMPDGVTKDTVFIFAPLNCPSMAARRADMLADKLTKMGVPNTRGSYIGLHWNNPSAEEQVRLNRVADIINGEVPAVFVNGMGKANPSPEEVAVVFHRTQ